MAVRYPENCRNVTAGALRQIKQTGSTTAGGGMFSRAVVDQMVLTGHSTFLRHNEPLGRFMTALSQASEDITKTADAVSASSRKMVETAEAATDKLNDASRKMRESTDKLGAAMTKFSAIYGSSKFAEQAEAAAKMADALERMAALEVDGKLGRVMAAMAQK